MGAQDPGEQFDLVDETGEPLGRTKARGLVHRDGDWHRSLHVWVMLDAGQSGGQELLFQRRSRDKDTWPGALDVAVTGHYRAGETLREALREAQEEIGLPLGVDDVTRLGRRWRRDDHARGTRDSEIQDILFARTGRALTDLTLGAAEVDALVALPFHAAWSLFHGEITHASATERTLRGAPRGTSIVTGDLVQANDGYYERALESIAGLLVGAPVPPWVLGDRGGR